MMKLSIFVFFYALIAVSYITTVTANKSYPPPPPCCSWTGWTYPNGQSCSAHCGPGNITRTRSCYCPAGAKGKCPDPQCTQEVTPCNLGGCCSWGSFGNWSTCVNSSQSRARNCTCKDARTGAVSTLTGSAAVTRCGSISSGSSSGDDCESTGTSSNLDTQACCSWGPWTNGSCSKNCGGGIQTRTRQCICGTGSSSGNSKTVPATCVGSASDSPIACNTFNCCKWGNLSDWTTCNATCGGVRRRSAVCNCTNPNPTTPSPTSKPTPATQQNNTQLTCPGPQPIQEEACPGCCVWGPSFTEWTQCDKICNGTQYRRQRCMCPGDDVDFCPDNYDDTRCIGVPLNETQSCNVGDDGTCCQWGFLEFWSVCVPDNHCCGNGTQWRKQGCICGGNVADPSLCIATSGQTSGKIETRLCTNGTCCGLQYTNTTCADLQIDDLSVCVTAPFQVGSCVCSDPTASQICPLDFNNPPVLYNHTSDCPPPPDYPADFVQCTEYRYNNTANADICYEWQVYIDTQSGQVTQITNPAPSLGASDCLPSSNCYDDWTDWSTCCGTCTAAYQYRVQTAHYPTSCRQPPGYQFRNCTLDNCCTWNRDDTKPWSDCSAINCGQGIQTRLPYNCSCGETCDCGENSLCGPPPPEETRTCNSSNICCQFTAQSETTSCQIIRNCTGTSWNTQICTCPDSRGSSTCDIENCYGVPSTGTPPCTCNHIPLCEWRETVSNCTGSCNSTTKPTPTGTTSTANRTGTQTVTRKCYCDGVIAANKSCNALSQPLVQTISCPLICNCTWINITNWSVCSASCSGVSRDSSRTKRGGYKETTAISYTTVTGTQSLTRRCSCDAASQSGTSTYSNACGGQTVIQQPCSVQCQTNSNQRMMDSSEVNAKLSTTDETSDQQQSSFLMIFIPTIIVVAIVGIAATLVFIKTRNKLVIDTTKSHHRLPNETDNTLV